MNLTNMKPKHYPNAGKNDLIRFALENNVGAIEFNIIKYVLRYKDKNGIEDLKKAAEYLNRLIDHEEKQKQRQLLKEITEADEKDGLYDDEETPEEKEALAKLRKGLQKTYENHFTPPLG